MDEDNLYFIFENCSYGDLSTLISKSKNGLDNEMAVQYAAEIVTALEFMHGKGYVHRDLKPENIMIGDDKHVRIIDLGDSKNFESFESCAEITNNYMHKKENPEEVDENEFFQSEDSGSDSRGTFCGTALYVSPEMLEESLAIPASDLWALGCIIYRMHSRLVPFQGPTEIATFDKILKREIHWPDNMSPDTCDIIDRLLQVDPRRRLGYQGFHELK